MIRDARLMTSPRDERGILDARSALLRAGAEDLARRPWQHPREMPDDVALARFALWRASRLVGAGASPELEAGLALIDSARSELDAVEAALVFTARAEGMTWARIAETMGMRSPQAAQQRFQRSAERQPATERQRSGDGDRDSAP